MGILGTKEIDLQIRCSCKKIFDQAGIRNIRLVDVMESNKYESCLSWGSKVNNICKIVTRTVSDLFNAWNPSCSAQDKTREAKYSSATHHFPLVSDREMGLWDKKT